MTEEEYKLIREGLISLMTVGSTINIVLHGLGTFDCKTFKYKDNRQIRKSDIEGIDHENKLLRINSANSGFIITVEFASIEMYEGQLYVWTTTQRSCAKKVQRLAEVLNDKTTSYD
jgi:Trk-type K+ transport system membrane component